MAQKITYIQIKGFRRIFTYGFRKNTVIFKTYFSDLAPKRAKATATPAATERLKSQHHAEATEQGEQKNEILDFTDYKRAFQAKTTFEILRALCVYKLCSYDFLVNRNKQLIKMARNILGKHGFELLMKSTFYGHFVAGETQVDIKDKLSLMKKYGVGAILDYAVEADIPKTEIMTSAATDYEEEGSIDLADAQSRYHLHKEFIDRRERVVSARTYFYEGEEKCDKNMEVLLQCIDTTGNTSEHGFAAIKVTALGRPMLLLRLSQILNQTQFYFDQMANQTGILTKRHIAQNAFIKGLNDLGVDMSEEDSYKIFNIIDTTQDGGIDVIEWHNFLTPQLQLAKLFRAKPTIKNKFGKEVISTLTTNELKEIENMTERLVTIALRAKERNVRLMVDAEQTYFQPAITRITLEAMRMCNREKPIVFNTYQCYLKNVMDSVLVDIELSRREGFYFAAKLVRGAYMEQERLRALNAGYPDPIHDTHAETNRYYNNVLETLLEEAHKHNANVMVATHNQESVRHALSLMKSYNIKATDDKIFFGQLLGMCDAVTYALGAAGYSAYKYVPYGPVEEVIPYLSRRAMENRSLMKGVINERSMLWNELKRRIKSGQFGYNPRTAVP